MKISFCKYQGSGNDFILIDDRESRFPLHDTSYIQFLCHRRKGIGADGLILLKPSQKADFRMRIFNADGSEANMCGNGLRCLVHFANQRGLCQTKGSVEVSSRLVPFEILLEEIQVDLGPYAYKALLKPLSREIYLIDVGVPHAVIFVENDNLFEIEAAALRTHPAFGSEGANINFAIVKDGIVRSRTMERGVAEETLSCGSGAIAIAAQQKYQLSNPITVVPLSQEALKVKITPTSATLIGKATFVFGGTVVYNESYFQ
jgi:diaminopimelate epimerase